MCQAACYGPASSNIIRVSSGKEMKGDIRICENSEGFHITGKIGVRKILYYI
jgi:hypothetical protein